MRRIAEGTFDALDEAPGEAVDLLDRLCLPVPALVIGELLGVPADLHPGLRDAATSMVTFDAASPESGRRLVAAIGWLTTTFTDLVAAKRARPGDDLISEWLCAADDARTLSEDELVSLAFLMMLAGLENAVHLCGNLIATLLGSGGVTAADWPARRRDLMERANPLPFAIRRFAVTELTVGGQTISRGDTVLLSIFGADSDPARAGRPSLMFGRGPHYCLGAQTADLIVDAVVPEFFARYPKARLTVPESELTYRDSWRAHGLVALPVALGG